MTKNSRENRGANLYRTGFNPPPPPPQLHEPEANLWRSIAGSVPRDWFTPATERLLMRYVRSAILAEELHNALDRELIGTPKAAELLRQVVALNGSLGTLAARMRLSTQVTMTARSTGRMAERAAWDDDLALAPAYIRAAHSKQ
jgi:hypothetical protein